MNKDSIRKTLNSLLADANTRAAARVLPLIVERVISTLESGDPSNAAFIAELEAWANSEVQQDRLQQFALQLWDDIKTADLRFIRRLPKVSYIYEICAYWWKPRQILFTCEEERTFYHRVVPEFEYHQPEISSDPRNIYLDKLIFDPQYRRFHLEPIPEINEWWEQHVSIPLFQKNIFVKCGVRCSAIDFPEEKARELQSLASANKEWYIPGFPDVTKFGAELRRKGRS
jgi:hypothetical protein